jgi:hypothetical protein
VAVTNTLAYYDMATITAVKCFRVEGISKFFSLKLSDSNFILRNNKEVDLFEETRYPQLGNCDIHSNRNILFVTGTK